MGFSRYWTRTDKKIDEKFVLAVNGIIADCKKKGIKIRNGLGIKEPEVTLNGIIINGDTEAKQDLSHETFHLDNNSNGWDFCKTAGKPYDYAVDKILEYAEKNGFVIDVSSDGECILITDRQYIYGEEPEDFDVLIEEYGKTLGLAKYLAIKTIEMCNIGKKKEIEGFIYNKLVDWIDE